MALHLRQRTSAETKSYLQTVVNKDGRPSKHRFHSISACVLPETAPLVSHFGRAAQETGPRFGRSAAVCPAEFGLPFQYRAHLIIRMCDILNLQLPKPPEMPSG